MNREILFRGKRTDNKEWVYWNQFGECTEPLLTDECMCSHISEQYVDPDTVGRYTGFELENEKIWEDDILWDNHYEERYIVYWDADEGEWRAQSESAVSVKLSNLLTEDVDMRGNIHDKEGK